MNALAGIRPNFPRGSKPDPPSFFSLAFSVGVICFPVGVQPPRPPANFYPALNLKVLTPVADAGRRPPSAYQVRSS